MFSVEDRERAQHHLLELANTDPRVVAAAVVGAEARGAADRWSDVDLTFGVATDADVADVLGDWTAALARELDAVELFDIRVGATIYRVFLLPGNLQVDLSFTPARQFGALGPDFKLLFGSAVERPRPAAAPARQLLGLGVHHAVRARLSIERGRPWQAEYWISACRDQALALACRRHGLEGAYGRGYDRLPPELLAKLEPALVGSLERPALLHSLTAALDALLEQVEDDAAAKLAPRLRELAEPAL